MKNPVARYTKEALEQEADLGPAMLALNPRQRGFVLAKFELGDHPSDSECARAAGYPATNSEYLKVQAHRLAHSDKIIAAIREEATRRAANLLPLAHRRMNEKLLNPADKDNWAVVKHIQGLEGIAPKQIHEVHHVVDRKALIQEIEGSIRLLQTLGIKLDQTLIPPQTVEVIDTEYEEGGTTEGLEDLL
jgi:hypothetical protein